jgi:hypothetical protein
MRSYFNSNFEASNVAGQTAVSQIPTLSDTISNTTLAENTAVSITVPTGATVALITASSSSGNNIPFWICDGSVSTAAIPSATVTTGGVSFNRQVIGLIGITHLSVISNTAGFINIEWLVL